MSLTFKYNDSGLRTHKTVTQNGTTATYTYAWSQDGRLISQTDGTVTLHFIYDENDEILGFAKLTADTSELYYYVKNLQGDVYAIVNSNGTVVAEYLYDAWGYLINITGSQATTLGVLNPIRYRSYYYDTETGYYYLQSRYYDPLWGRFINADEYTYIDQTKLVTNFYAYCYNNPANYIDMSGYISLRILGGPALFQSTLLLAEVNFLCVRLYLWGFTHRTQNKTYDFSKTWKNLITKRLKKSQAVIDFLNQKISIMQSKSVKEQTFKTTLNFYSYLKETISDFDLTMSIGGGGKLTIKIKHTNKYDKENRAIYKVTISLKDEVFDFEYWDKNTAHSNNMIVTLINNIGYMTQHYGAFVYFTWIFTVSFETTYKS